MAVAASSAETRARCRPSPVNGSRNPAASPASNQPGPGAAGHPMPDGPRPLDAVEGLPGAPGGRVVRRGRDRGDEPRGHGLRAVASDRRAPRRTEDDPDVDPPARDRRDADVPVADEPHPGVALRGAVRIGEVVREAEARREPGRPGDAGGSGHDRAQAVGADDDACRQGEPLVRSGAVHADRRRGRRRSRSSPGGRRRPPLAARSSSAGSSAERSNPTAGSPPPSAP